jgi:ribose-phosphate pyrophosphokinase
MITDAIRRRTKSPIYLILPYLPYARQDHISTVGESLSLKVFADLINAQQYAKVICYDAHSEVAKALIDNLKVINQETVIGYVFGNLGISLNGVNIVSPDFGATKKIGRLCSMYEVNRVIQADKTRDLKTGKITGIEVYCGDLEGQDVIIVDDIIDGGATFAALAEALHKKNCGRVTLYATHGILAKGSIPIIDAGIDQIITTDTITPKELFGVTVVPIVGKLL